jgi:hypothetical protein
MGMRFDDTGRAVAFDGLLTGVQFGVNEFHLGAHGFACQVLHGANSLPGACKLDYEFVERLNRYLSHVGPLSAWRSLTGRRELLACTAARTQRLAHVRLPFEVVHLMLGLPADEAVSVRSLLEAGHVLDLWDDSDDLPGNWLERCASPMAEVRSVVGSIARTARTNAEAARLSLRTRIVAETYLGEQLRQKKAKARNAHDQKIGGQRLDASAKGLCDNLRKLVDLEKSAAAAAAVRGSGGVLAEQCCAGQFPWHTGPVTLPDPKVLADKLSLYQRANK